MTNLQEAADLNDTVAVSARRFEESPFILRQDDSKMVRGIHLNVLLLMRYTHLRAEDLVERLGKGCRAAPQNSLKPMCVSALFGSNGKP